MAFANPIVGASIAVGWLVGSWLFGPKADQDNKVFDPGAEEMPDINQSLRGATLGVAFGTNRLSPQITWVKNFTTIRHETKDSAGGGKAGGSGMKGPTSGGTTEVTYEYKWDMMFHLGMGPGPYNLFGGWLGADRLNDETLANIIQGDEGTLAYFRSDVDRPRNAALAFESAYFGFGHPTSNLDAENWTHFQSQEGFGCIWPSTFYIGFKQLNLGNSARVPQLTFEVGPGEASIDYDPEYLQISGTDFNGSSTSQLNGANGFIVGEDGVLYSVSARLNTGSGSVDVVNVTTGAVTRITSVQMLADSPVSTGIVTGDRSTFVIPFPETPYFLGIQQCSITGATNPYGDAYNVNEIPWVGTLYKIDATGTIVVAGGFRMRAGGVTVHPTQFEALGFYGQGSPLTDMPVVAYTNGAGVSSARCGVFFLPTLTQLKNNYAADSSIGFTANMVNQRCVLLGGVSGTTYRGLFDGGYATYNQTCGRAFFLPMIDPSLPDPWFCKVATYVTKQVAAYHADGSTTQRVEYLRDTFLPSYPDGGIVAFNVTGKENGDGSFTTSFASPEVLNNSFVEMASGTPIVPFDDDGLDRAGDNDGGEYTWAYDYQQSVGAVTRAQGLYVTLFGKLFSGSSADTEGTGSWTRFRVFVWNPYSGEATYYGQEEGSWFDTETDTGVAAINKFNNTPSYVYPVFREADESITMISFYSAGSVAPLQNRYVYGRFGLLSLGGGEDVLVPQIIYYILTSKVFGFGKDPARIDQATYAEALAYCDAEKFRVSVNYDREDNFLSVIDQLLSLYGGYLIDSGGIIKFGVHQFDTLTTPRVIDNHHLISEDGKPPVEIVKMAQQDTYNKVKVNFFDRDLEYRQNIVEVSDEVDQDFSGVRAKEFPVKFVMKPELASKIAERALWANLYSKDQYQFKLGPKDADLEPGDPITLQDSFHPELAGGVRALIVNWKEERRLVFTVTAVLQQEYILTATRSFFDTKSPGTGSSLFSDTMPPADFRMYELPAEFQASAANVYVGYNQLSTVMGAYLWLSSDGESYSLVSNAQPYIISGIIAAPLPDRDPGYVEQNVLLYLMPGSGFNPASPTWAQTHQLDDISQSFRASGAGTIICGSEAMAVQGLTLLGQNTYLVDKLYRGWGGTNVQDHSSGAYWHRHGGGMFVQEINVDRIGTRIWYKVQPYNFAGQPYDVASIVGKDYTILGRYFRPQNSPRIETFVQSNALPDNNSVEIRGSTYRNVVSGGSDVVFKWDAAAQKEGYGFQGYGISGYGHFAPDTTTPSYRVNVTSSNGFVVHSTVVNTGFFTYGRAQNSADFSGFKGDFNVDVTAFNTYGDAAVTQVRTMRLF